MARGNKRESLTRKGPPTGEQRRRRRRNDDPALKRVADLGQGWYGFSINPQQTAERLRVLDRLLETRGRSRKEVEVRISPYLNPFDLDLVKGYRDVGVDQDITR